MGPLWTFLKIVFETARKVIVKISVDSPWVGGIIVYRRTIGSHAQHTHTYSKTSLLRDWWVSFQDHYNICYISDNNQS